MRVLIATYSLAFQNSGGGERVLEQVSCALTELGHTAYFFEPTRSVQPQVDVVHYFSTLEPFQWPYLKKIFRAPLVVSPSIHFASKKKSTLRSLLRSLANREKQRVRSSVDLWIPNTDLERRGLTADFGVDPKKIRTVSNGVSETFFTPNKSLFTERTRLSSGFVLNVGRFHPVKQQQALIESLGGKNITTVFIGGSDIDQRTYFDTCQRVASRWPGQFHFLGPIQDDQFLASAYANCGAFVLPSQFETFGLSALEATLSGCPLVLTQKLGAKDFFELGAVWIDPDESATWYPAILRALQKDRSPLVAPEKLRWSTIAKQLVDCYHLVT